MMTECVEQINVRAEQVAFVGRAMERENEECSLMEYFLKAALQKAEFVIGSPAPGKQVK